MTGDTSTKLLVLLLWIITVSTVLMLTGEAIGNSTLEIATGLVALGGTGSIILGSLIYLTLVAFKGH